jgi:hypothetical protein
VQTPLIKVPTVMVPENFKRSGENSYPDSSYKSSNNLNNHNELSLKSFEQNNDMNNQYI